MGYGLTSGVITPAIAAIVARKGYDAVVEWFPFESAGRPDYLIDRHPVEGRLTRAPDEVNPYRFVLAREISNLPITRTSAYCYTVYSIEWSVVDRTREHVADRTRGGREHFAQPGPAWRGPVAGGRSPVYNSGTLLALPIPGGYNYRISSRLPSRIPALS